MQRSKFKVIIKGNTAHGSAPHLGNDAVFTASSMILNIQGIAGRMNDPLNPLTINVGTIKGGQRFNIIANHTEFEGIIETPDSKILQEMKDKLAILTNNSAMMYGCSVKIEFDGKEVE